MTTIKLKLSAHGEALAKLNDTVRLRVRQQHEEAKLRAEELKRQAKLWIEARNYDPDAPAEERRAEVLAGTNEDEARGIRTPDLPAYMTQPTGYEVTNRHRLAAAYWIIWQNGEPQPMSTGEITRETLALINLHNLGQYRRRAQAERDAQAREAAILTLKHNRQVKPLMKYTDLTFEEAQHRFEEQVRQLLTDASFADWDNGLAWCQYQLIYGACMNAWSNLRTTSDQVGKLTSEGKALAREAGAENCSAYEDELEQLRDRLRKMLRQEAFWEWRFEAAQEAYRRLMAQIQTYDKSEARTMANLSSEWHPPAKKMKHGPVRHLVRDGKRVA